MSESRKLSIESGQLQFGCGYANPRHFKKRFLGYLKSVIDYYPEVRLEVSGAGLVLRPSPTHIAQRPSTGSDFLKAVSDSARPSPGR